MRFTTTIELGGKTATGMQVPADVVESLGRGKRVPVVVTIRGHSYRSTVAVYGGAYYLPLAAEHREAAAVASGDVVEVDIEVDDAPRQVEVPGDLAQALSAQPVALGAFEALSYSRRRQIVQSVEGAKTAATRGRRIERAVTDLAGG